MVLATLVILAVMALAIIGIGVVPFFTGVYNVAQTIYQNPTIKSTANQAGQYILNLISNAAQTK
jgi:hypothetical protein